MGKHSQDYTQYLRAELEAEIERLIALCDTIDGDADHEDFDEDLEPDADGEPWLAGFGGAGDDIELEEAI